MHYVYMVFSTLLVSNVV